jgi:hypothetical protein
MEQSANETFIRGVKANEIHSPDPLIPPSNDPFKNGLFSSITDPLNNIGLNIQRFLHYPEDFFTNGFTSYNPPISARYSAIDGELARQAGWTPQQAEFNYYGGRDIGLALSILIPAGSAYSSAVSTAAGLNSAAALVDDTVGGATGDAGNVLDWSNVNKNGQTSLEHVNKHGIPNYQRANHGVFSGNPQTMVERAWANKGNLQPITDGMGGSIYNIFYQNAGYQSGYQYFGQQMDYITIITQDGTSIVWSAFPSFGNYGANLVP